MKKHNTRTIRKHKLKKMERPLQMLTCYDYQTARLLDGSTLDLILVGDSLGNVVLGYDTTVSVSLEEMIIFCSAVKRGAENKFVIGDMPFGSCATVEKGIDAAIRLMQESGVEAVKIEGAHPHLLQLIERLTRTGIPVMGHIGLTPQSVHEMGGYYTHGKDVKSAGRLLEEARALEKAGAFSLVLECVTPAIAEDITAQLSIPTIGIGAGDQTDGQVLVINDLFKMGPETPPKFCTPIADLHGLRRELLEEYLNPKNHLTPTGKTDSFDEERLYH
jgi:3-methyl-2-oxobutanoate hydroxymethyltransferase